MLPYIHNEKLHEDVQQSDMNVKNNKILHTLATLACSREKNDVIKSKNTTSVIHDKHNGDPEKVMSLLTYMVTILKIQKDT